MIAVIALLPERFVRWIGWFHTPAITILGPVSGPMRSLSAWLNPTGSRVKESELVEELRRQVETLTQQTLRDEEEIQRLNREMKEAYGLTQLNPGAAVRQLGAPVIGTSSDLSSRILTVRAGERQGIEKNTVVVAPGLQLLGKVVKTEGRTCDVQPITSKAAPGMLGRVMLEGAARPLVSLEPVGDGTLRGAVGVPGAGEDAREPNAAPPQGSQGDLLEIKPGTVVRLADPGRWPPHAQMLIIGTVEREYSNPQQPLRRMVIVRPTLELERVSNVVLRVAEESDAVLNPGKEKAK